MGGSSIVFDGINSKVNAGKALKSVSDPNHITLGIWVNLQELESNKRYPLVSINNGFEWWIDKDGDNAKLNFYQHG
jgi:hypothetical protein